MKRTENEEKVLAAGKDGIVYVSEKVEKRVDAAFMDEVSAMVSAFIEGLSERFGDMVVFSPGQKLYKWEDEGEIDGITMAHLHYDECVETGEPVCRIAFPPFVVYKNGGRRA